MTFIEACELIADVKDNYKVVYPSFLSRQEFSFKFERSGKQYDAFDVVYEHCRTLRNLPLHDTNSLSAKIKALGMSIDTFSLLSGLSNGAWKKDVPIFMRIHYAQAKREFEQVTGIKFS